jgi:hypothetical protein
MLAATLWWDVKKSTTSWFRFRRGCRYFLDGSKIRSSVVGDGEGYITTFIPITIRYPRILHRARARFFETGPGQRAYLLFFTSIRLLDPLHKTSNKIQSSLEASIHSTCHLTDVPVSHSAVSRRSRCRILKPT